ncbi:MAG: DNA mismatch repair protein MutS, partial [Rikenellaceae bacterium]|nr:DNA mismatch repair protein MutS [Rikenellaceae bacterium]
MAAEKNKAEKSKKSIVETPLMKQYFEIKAQHPDAVLLFRVGDFYETYGEDAVRASAILGITLTRRANGAAAYVEMAGFPYHAVETYLPKLVRAGQRVAICEQLEDPKTVKGLVKRGVVELVTPGVSLSNNTLAAKENNFLASVYFGRKYTGVAFLDISTGEFYVGRGSNTYVDKLLSNFAPKEVLFQRGFEACFRENFGGSYYTFQLDEWIFSEDLNRRKLCEQFDVRNLKGYGIESMGEGISAAGAILYYLEFTEHRATGHIRGISRIDADRYVWVDKFSIRNLELFSSNDPTGQGSLLSVLDRTMSPMGGRLLRQWIALPIKDLDALNRRLDIVEDLCEDAGLKECLGEQLSLVGDLERLAQRIATGRILPREMVQLKNSLGALESIATLCAPNQHLSAYTSQLDLCKQARERIAHEIYSDPETNQIAKGGIIADGVDVELDDLRRVAGHGKEVLCEIQRRESELTGIPSLKISYNNVFGYYIEVRNTHKD